MDTFNEIKIGFSSINIAGIFRVYLIKICWGDKFVDRSFLIWMSTIISSTKTVSDWCIWSSAVGWCISSQNVIPLVVRSSVSQLFFIRLRSLQEPFFFKGEGRIPHSRNYNGLNRSAQRFLVSFGWTSSSYDWSREIILSWIGWWLPWIPSTNHN